jgi:tripeptidyl-peptidase I
MSYIQRLRAYNVFHDFFGYLISATIRFAVSNGNFPLNVVPLERNGTATQAGPQPASVPPACSSIITPACLQGLYGIPTTRATQSSNRMAVTGYINSWAQQADLSVGYFDFVAVILF